MVGLRDRVPISFTTFAFARIGAVVAMRGGDDYQKGRAGGSDCRARDLSQQIPNKLLCHGITLAQRMTELLDRAPARRAIWKK
jgi:hypothetical protein